MHSQGVATLEGSHLIAFPSQLSVPVVSLQATSSCTCTSSQHRKTSTRRSGECKYKYPTSASKPVACAYTFPRSRKRSGTLPTPLRPHRITRISDSVRQPSRDSFSAHAACDSARTACWTARTYVAVRLAGCKCSLRAYSSHTPSPRNANVAGEWMARGSTPSALLPAFEDAYGGLVVDQTRLPRDAEAFASALRRSMRAWRASGKRGVWLSLPTSRVRLVAPAVEQGFAFHHAEETHVMLAAWLPEDQPNTLPPNASHQVGVGGVVTNAKGQLLVVQEKHGPLRGKGIWKIPTGLAETGEEVADAAVREVEEETGIKTTFHQLVSFRQSHGLAFGKSDLFFICALQPIGQQDIVVQEKEIECARWMPVDEYIQQEFFQRGELHKKMNQVIAQVVKNGAHHGFEGRPLETARPGQFQYLYYPSTLSCIVHGEAENGTLDASRQDGAGENTHTE